MKHFFRTLLGLVLMVFVFSGCEDPSRLEIPDGATVEFVWGESPWVDSNIELNENSFKYVVTRYLSDLHKDGGGNWVFEYPKGYDLDKYNDLYNNNKVDFEKLYEKTFEEALGTNFYEEGTVINLTDMSGVDWTSPAKDLAEKGFYSLQLYFLAEDIGTNYSDIKSLETVEVHNENIKVYVYLKYFEP